MSATAVLADALARRPRARLAILATPLERGPRLPSGAGPGTDDWGQLGAALEGRFGPDDIVIFWHTGGQPAVFAPDGAAPIAPRREEDP